MSTPQLAVFDGRPTMTSRRVHWHDTGNRSVSIAPLFGRMQTDHCSFLILSAAWTIDRTPGRHARTPSQSRRASSPVGSPGGNRWRLSSCLWCCSDDVIKALRRTTWCTGTFFSLSANYVPQWFVKWNSKYTHAWYIFVKRIALEALTVSLQMTEDTAKPSCRSGKLMSK